MKRREFIKGSAVIALAAGTGNGLRAASLLPENPLQDDQKDPLPEEEAAGPLIVSAPMLQNYAEESMGVAFAVSDLANGYVIVGRKPDLSDGRKVLCGGYRVTDLDDRIVRVRLTGLKPATRYYYRIGADRIRYKGGYDMKVVGNEEAPEIHSFTTAGKKAEGHFCVINDTHARWEPFERVIDKVAECAPACVIWNGDACNVEETVEAQTRIFLKPEIGRQDYAADLPYLFCAGNHDSRGMANRHFERVWMFRQPEERAARDWDLGRNFAVRTGQVALIGLDTAEDKLDDDPRFAGLFTSAPYREAQVAWLRDALQREEIASAPYLVAFCHIPLFDPRPDENPGDVAPDAPEFHYRTDFAAWQRTCARLWTPLLEKAGCQLIVTAHQHRYRYDAPTADRTWAQLVGGGPDLPADPTAIPEAFPTVIEGKVRRGKLEVTVHNVRTGKVQDTFTFAPRA